MRGCGRREEGVHTCMLECFPGWVVVVVVIALVRLRAFWCWCRLAADSEEQDSYSTFDALLVEANWNTMRVCLAWKSRKGGRTWLSALLIDICAEYFVPILELSGGGLPYGLGVEAFCFPLHYLTMFSLWYCSVWVFLSQGPLVGGIAESSRPLPL